MKRNLSIMLLITMLTLAILASASTVKRASAQASQTYYAVEPSEVVMGPLPDINQTFTVTVKLYNASASFIPSGVVGVEVHVTWNTSFIEPVSFVNEITLPGGVLNGSTVLYGINPGFYNVLDNKINNPPYTSATHYRVAAASTTGPWWGSEGMVAQITFQVDQQTAPYVTCPISIDFTDIVNGNQEEVTPGDSANATYINLAVSTTSETISFNGADYTITIASDSNITAPANMGFLNYTQDGASFNFTATSYDGFCNVTIPNSFMWSIPTNNWTVWIDDLPVTLPSANVAFTSDPSNVYIWLNLTSGTHNVFLRSMYVIPELTPTTGLMLLLMTTTLVGAAAISLRRKRLHY